MHDRIIQAITGLRKLEVDECFSMPCLNSGSCLPFESGYYKISYRNMSNIFGIVFLQILGRLIFISNSYIKVTECQSVCF